MHVFEWEIDLDILASRRPLRAERVVIARQEPAPDLSPFPRTLSDVPLASPLGRVREALECARSDWSAAKAAHDEARRRLDRCQAVLDDPLSDADAVLRAMSEQRVSQIAVAREKASMAHLQEALEHLQEALDSHWHSYVALLAEWDDLLDSDDDLDDEQRAAALASFNRIAKLLGRLPLRRKSRWFEQPRVTAKVRQEPPAARNSVRHFSGNAGSWPVEGRVRTNVVE